MNNQTAQLLEQHFDTAFSAPGGIARLRELILTLAMQGMLVEQDPSDPPASKLLKEIEAEKQRLVTAGKIKTPKPLPPIKPEEVPYALPQGWEWVRLGQIGIVNPRNDAGDSAKAGFVPMPMIPESYSEKHQFEERPWSEIKKGYTHFADGDVGMAKITPCFENAKSCVFSDLPNGIGAGTTELHIFRNSFNSVVPRFLLYYLKNPHYISKALSSMTGSAGQKRVPTPYFTQQLFPLPPLPEQHRIVARIDQLMARCDELEELRKQRDAQRLAVHAAAIKELLDPSLQAVAPSREPFAFLARHFGELYTVKENVAGLRKAILQLAVMGRLVPQDPNDPPASELLQEIGAEKQRLVNAGEIKNPKELPPIKPGEVPYALPQGWEWVRLGDLTTEIVTGPFGSMIHKSDYVLDGIPLINPSHMIDGKIVHDWSVSVSHNMARKLSSYRLLENDIVMARRGEMGRCAIVTTESDGFLCGTGSFVLRFIDNIDRQYVLNLFKTEYVREYLGGNSVGTTMTNLNHGILNNMPLLLPPLPEQHRIVARIDQLMALCDTLDQQIDAATNKQSELLNAVMAGV